MEIYGIGIDVVETKRIEHSLERFGDRFLKRIYLPGELDYCHSMKFSPLHLAARFAAKEAISKAFGTGIGKTIGWTDMEIVKVERGAPQAVLHGGAQRYAAELGVTKVLCSLSHTEHYAAANAVAIME